MALKTLLVAPTPTAIWRRDFTLAIPPFPGLGIRLDVYEMVNVDSVVVGDTPYDVTCIVSPEGGEVFPPEKWTALGFEVGPYPV